METNNKALKITFLGATSQVTGSNFLVETSEEKILVDCGLFQETLESEKKNVGGFPFNPREINYLFVTHGHIDHIGRIPKLVRDGFRGQIISTPETKEIALLLLEDALKVMGYRKLEKGKEPLYEEKDITESFKLWKTVSYRQTFKLKNGLEVVLKNAGHVLGSAMVEFKRAGSLESLVFTGDLGSWPNPLLQKTDSLDGVKYLVMESVYGDRNHISLFEGERNFRQVVEKIIKNSGTLLIPSFSLERSQVVLFELNKLIENKIIPHIPVFFDSPLAIKLTEIYKRSKHLFNTDIQNQIRGGDDIFDFSHLVISKTSFDSKLIENTKGSKIIIAGSGMSQGGRIVYHEAKYLEDEKNAVLLLGYQGIGTLGRRLLEGEKQVLIQDKPIKVKASIESIDSFSAHKDSDGLLQFVADNGDHLKKVFCVMGEPRASLFLAQKIKDNLNIDCVAPKEGENYLVDL
ncbi:MAG: MBL fold metallo-hydrolase [Patescibacteria group bacterium]